MFLGGWLVGVLMLSLAAVLAYYSMKILLLSANKTGIYSYGALLSHATSPVAGPLLDVVIVLYGSGVVIAYYVFLGDFIPSLAEVIGIEFLQDRTKCLIVCCIMSIPLGFPKRLSALQYISPVSTIALVLTAIVSVLRVPRMRDELTPEQAELDIAIPSMFLLKCFTISLFAFICHMNVVSVAGELIHPTSMRASKIARRASLTQLVFYIVIGVCGYMSFGQTVHQNFITNYPSGDHLIVVCRLLLSLTIFFALPMNTNPTANAFVHFLLTTGIAPDSSSPMEQPLFEATSPDGEPVVMEPEPLRYVRIMAAILVLVQGMTVAIYAPGIADVISILGGSFGTLIMLVCPMIIYVRVFPEEFRSEKKSKLMIYLLGTGSVVSAVAVACTVLHVIV